MWQDALVTILALAATGVLARRLFVSRKKPEPSCASCPSARQAKRSTLSSHTGETRPLVLIRK